MLSQLSLLLLLSVALGVHDCTRADELQCLSSICYNYSYTNTSCVINPGNTCTSGQVLYNSVCVTCSTLPASNCSTICPDFNYRSTASPPQCTKCGTTFSDGCVRCTSSVCLVCGFSTNLTVSADGQMCVNSTCTDPLCVTCYSAGTKCYRCKTGYTVSTTSFKCINASCSIANCLECASASTCANCFPNYDLKLNSTVCEPICSDLNCVNCIAPGVCGTCLPAYAPNTVGLCVVDCSQIPITNCATCINEASCTSCKAGFTLQNQGSACVPTCLVTNCDVCLTGDTSTCRKCNIGFALSADGKTCTSTFCYIENCQGCLTLNQCAQCISNYTLSGDNKTCDSACPYVNCQLCSNTGCTTCDDGYILNVTNGSCYLICQAISNCVRCLSLTQCASCERNYLISADRTACVPICRDSNCLTCSNPNTLSCTTCKTGFSVNPATSRCQKLCQEGQVDTSSTSTINCQDCAVLVANCKTCTYLSGNTICKTCTQSYFLNGQQCERCDAALDNCLLCSSLTVCTLCSSTTKLIGGVCQVGTCDAAVANCYACRSTATNVCAVCNTGYRLVNNVCVSVVCTTGFIIDLTNDVCVCPLGAYKKDSVCLSCQNSACVNCTISTCYECQQGFYAVGTNCLKCIDNCKTCTTGSNCVECDTGYSKGFDGTCFSFSNGQVVAPSDVGVYYGCPEGCRLCVVGGSAAQRVICLIPRSGYALSGGSIVKCSSICRTCSATQPALCSSCYPQYVLTSGTCVACVDPQAITCAAINTNYSLTCNPGFTSTFNPATGATGVCTACSAYCFHCEATGPGQCDEGQCAPGSVQLIGTTNCTQCFDGCVTCDSANLNNCLDCGFRRFVDPTTTTCTRCTTGCKNCSNTATNCQACDQGYFLVNGTTCLLIPANCFGLTAAGLCQGCLVGYALNADSTACVLNVSCNATSNCQNCPPGLYLNNQQCFSCSLPANCKQCIATNTTACIGCNKGFYLDSNSVCQTCITNCAACDSNVFCTQANPGFYGLLNSSNQYTGQIAACTSPCATCVDSPTFCLSCVADYTLTGSRCRRNSFITIVLVLGPGTGNNSIFSGNDTVEKQIFLTIAAVNRLIFAFTQAAPQELKTDGVRYRDKNIIQSITAGSVKVTQYLDAGSFTNADAAKNSVSNAFNNIDGATVVSSSVTTQGLSNQTQDDGGANLGLILGLSIPLGILLILIIILIVYSCRKDESEYGDDNKNGFYSEDKIDRAEEI